MQDIVIDPRWGFVDAVDAAWGRYSGGVMGMSRRTTVLRSWANVVGRARARSEIQGFIDEAGGVGKAANLLGMSPGTFRSLRRFVEQTPDPDSLEMSGGRVSEKMIRTLLSQGEGPHVEFKESMPPRARDLAKEIAAFATASGGVVLIGIDDTGGLVGFSENRERVEGTVQLVDPTPNVTVQVLGYEDVPICAVIVKSGAAPLYYVDATPYLRDGSLSRPAKPDEVIQKVLAAAEGGPGY